MRVWGFARTLMLGAVFLNGSLFASDSRSVTATVCSSSRGGQPSRVEPSPRARVVPSLRARVAPSLRARVAPSPGHESDGSGIATPAVSALPIEPVYRNELSDPIEMSLDGQAKSVRLVDHPQFGVQAVGEDDRCYEIFSLNKREIGLTAVQFMLLSGAMPGKSKKIDIHSLDGKKCINVHVQRHGENDKTSVKKIIVSIKPSDNPELFYALINGKWVLCSASNNMPVSKRVMRGGKTFLHEPYLTGDNLVVMEREFGGGLLSRRDGDVGLLYDEVPVRVPSVNQCEIPVFTTSEDGSLEEQDGEIMPDISEDDVKVSRDGKLYAPYAGTLLQVDPEKGAYKSVGDDQVEVACVDGKIALVQRKDDGTYQPCTGSNTGLIASGDQMITTEKALISDYPRAVQNVLSKDFHYIPVLDDKGDESQVKAHVFEAHDEKKIKLALAPDGSVYISENGKSFEAVSRIEALGTFAVLSDPEFLEKKKVSLAPYSGPPLAVASPPAAAALSGVPIGSASAAAIDDGSATKKDTTLKPGERTLLNSLASAPAPPAAAALSGVPIGSASAAAIDDGSATKPSKTLKPGERTLLNLLIGYGLTAAGALSVLYSVRKAMTGLNALEKATDMDQLDQDQRLMWKQVCKKSLRKVFFSGIAGALGIGAGIWHLNRTAAAA